MIYQMIFIKIKIHKNKKRNCLQQQQIHAKWKITVEH